MSTVKFLEEYVIPKKGLDGVDNLNMNNWPIRFHKKVL